MSAPGETSECCGTSCWAFDCETIEGGPCWGEVTVCDEDDSGTPIHGCEGHWDGAGRYRQQPV